MAIWHAPLPNSLTVWSHSWSSAAKVDCTTPMYKFVLGRLEAFARWELLPRFGRLGARAQPVDVWSSPGDLERKMVFQPSPTVTMLDIQHLPTQAERESPPAGRGPRKTSVLQVVDFLSLAAFCETSCSTIQFNFQQFWSLGHCSASQKMHVLG